MINKIVLSGFVGLIMWTLGLQPVLALGSLPAEPKLVISEVKLGGAVEGQPTEFVELYNNSDSVIDFDAEDWWLEYAKPKAVISDCSSTNWAEVDSGEMNVRRLKLSGVVDPSGYKVVEMSLNDNTAGALQVVGSLITSDLIGWGTSSIQAPCTLGDSAPAPTNTQSLQRLMSKNGLPVVNEDNSKAFVSAEPTPGQPGPTQSADDIPPMCNRLAINEVLPNPSGADSGKEFVEIFNPTADVVDLSGCFLQVGSSQEELSGMIGAMSHKAFFGLSLPNSAGGTVLLHNEDWEVSVSYPGGLGDDEAYGIIDGQWQGGLQPTPGSVNQVAVKEESKASESADDQPAPCAPGKYRSPETNRCRNIEVASSLAPCDSGQIRNPETNRCRKIASATADLVPCAEGQERNPETNRCRNKTSVKSASTSIADSQSSEKPVSYYVFGVMALLGVGYAIYEYRHSIKNFFIKRRQS